MGNQTTALKATLGGALGVVLVLITNYILAAFGHNPLPSELASALGVVFTGIFTYVIPHDATPLNLAGKTGPLIALLAAVGLSSCANPVATAQTPMQKAFAVYGTFTVAQGVALDVVKNEDIPAPVRKAVQASEGVAFAAVQTVADVARTILEDYPDGATPALEVRLLEAVAVAVPRVQALLEAIQRAREEVKGL